MGGSVRVVIRKADGEVVSQVRWTNPMPDRILNLNFLLDHPGYVDDYIKCAPLEEADDKDIAPVEYGIVFVDFVNKRLLSMQDYCTFGSMHGAGILMGLMGNVITDSPEYLDHNRLKAFLEYDTSMVLFSHYEGRPCPPMDVVLGKAALARKEKDDLLGADFKIDISKVGWSYKELDNSLAGSRQFREFMLATGIVPSVHAWDEYDEHLAEMERE